MMCQQAHSETSVTLPQTFPHCLLEVRHEALHRPKERARLLRVRGEQGPGQRQLASREERLPREHPH